MGFIFSIAGRFFTFSTGSFLNLIASFVVFTIVIFAIDKKLFKIIIVGGSVFGFCMLLYLYFSDLGSTLLYRIMLSDDYVLEASIGSRLSQYSSVGKAFGKNPEYLVFGFGNILTPQLMEDPIKPHNILLRVISGSGLIGLAMFMYLFLITFYVFLKNAFHSDSFKSVFSALMVSLFFGWFLQAQTLPADTSIMTFFYFSVALGIYGRMENDYRKNT